MSDLISRRNAINVFEILADKMTDAGQTVMRQAISVLKDLPSTEPERKWIPVSEALPQNYEQAICIDGMGKMMIGTYGEYGWIFPCYMTEPVAWMPLPEPAKIGDGK